MSREKKKLVRQKGEKKSWTSDMLCPITAPGYPCDCLCLPPRLHLLLVSLENDQNKSRSYFSCPEVPNIILKVRIRIHRYVFNYRHFFRSERLTGSIQVPEKMPTYPSPKSKLTVSSHLGRNVGLGEE